MSWAFDRVSAVLHPYREGIGASDVEVLAKAAAALEPFQEEIEALDYYQRSGLWMKDFETDESGKLPSGVRRSVLSEDGLYNLLEEIGSVYNTPHS